MSKRMGVVAVALVAVACSASEEAPSPGTYTLQFPSTAAAVATDTVQLLFFDVPKTQAERAQLCANIIQARKRKDPQKPAFQNTSVNICELSQGKKPVTIPYGEHAVFAIAVRSGEDFMLGCSIQTFGRGDAPLPIALSLVDVGNPVPDTTCGSVTDFCSRKCPAQ
ncbi:MAG TPA: hypothetical protein VLT33_30375 [Labilithrix sp.]|nr:hypothetical protein [Labilithrix sp.]